MQSCRIFFPLILIYFAVLSECIIRSVHAGFLFQISATGQQEHQRQFEGARQRRGNYIEHAKRNQRPLIAENAFKLTTTCKVKRRSTIFQRVLKSVAQRLHSTLKVYETVNIMFSYESFSAIVINLNKTSLSPYASSSFFDVEGVSQIDQWIITKDPTTLRELQYPPALAKQLIFRQDVNYDEFDMRIAINSDMDRFFWIKGDLSDATTETTPPHLKIQPH